MGYHWTITPASSRANTDHPSIEKVQQAESSIPQSDIWPL
ncbi:hypothetical protein TNCV_5108891, partial [Trichonephila clavipes]